MMKMFKTIGGALGFLAVLAMAYGFLPPPPHAQAQFYEQQTYGGTSTGSANAQVINIPNLSVSTPGVVLRFVPGFTNTGPTQINVSSIGLINVLRPSSIGNVAFSGGEFQSGELTCITYNGSVYQLSCNTDITPIGKTIEFRGTTAPRGSLIEDGSCVSQTTYAALFAVINTLYGSSCGGGLFALPDSRGTAFVALDGQGANGLAGRITSTSCATPNAIGICGHDTYTILTTNLPPYTPSGSVPITDPGHAHDIAYQQGAGNGTSNYPAAPTSNQSNSVSNAVWAGGGPSGLPVITNFTGITAGFAGSAQGGASTAHTILGPSSFGRRAIKY